MTWAAALARVSGLTGPALPESAMGREALPTATLVAVTPDTREDPMTAEARTPRGDALPTMPALTTTTPIFGAPPVAAVTTLLSRRAAVSVR